MKKWNNLLLAGIALLSACAIGVLFVNYDDEKSYLLHRRQDADSQRLHLPFCGGDTLRQDLGPLLQAHTFSGDCCGYGIKLRKTVMMPVLIRSENMAPMIGTMMKGTVA